MDKTLSRKLSLDKINGDIDITKDKIKEAEENVSYAQKEVQDLNDKLSTLKEKKKVVEVQLGMVQKVKKFGRKTKKVVASLLILSLIPTMLFAASDSQPKLKIEYDANDNPIYVGKAAPNTAEGSAFWQIRKITFDANNNPTDVKWADGNAKFDNEWDNRATLIYE